MHTLNLIFNNHAILKMHVQAGSYVDLFSMTSPATCTVYITSMLTSLDLPSLASSYRTKLPQ